MSLISKTLGSTLLAAAGLLAAGAAQARDVYWSVNVQAPVAGIGVGTVVSNVPRHAPPAYVQVPAYPAYPVYHPAPVVYAPVVQYRPVPPPRYYHPQHHQPRYVHRHHSGHKHWKHDDRRGHGRGHGRD